MKKFSKIAVKVLTVLTAASLVFANSGIKALADDIRFYVVKEGETVTDNTTANESVGVSTDKFFEMRDLRTTVTDEQIRTALKGINDGSFYNERSKNTFSEAVVSQNTEAEDLTVERILDLLSITYDNQVDWYVIKKHDDGYHVDGTKLTSLPGMPEVIEDIEELIINEPETPAGPADEPETTVTNDFYMVFSIAKADRIDKSYGTKFDGKNVKDYFQIKGVSENEDEKYNNSPINRYHINVNKNEIYGYMKEVLNTSDATSVVNETHQNGTAVEIASYQVERGSEIAADKLFVEDVLTKMGVIDEVTAKTRQFVNENSNIAAFVKEKYPDIDFSGNDWYIDWYVMKEQSNGIHVDGVFVTIYDEPEPTPEITPEITPEVTPEATPEVTPEATPEITPEVTPEATPEVTPEATPEVTPEATPEVTPEATPEVTPEVTPEATPEVTPEVTPEATPEVTPEATPEVTPEVTPEATPEVTPEATPEVTPEVTPEATPEATPEVTPEVTPEATPEATPEVTPEATPEVTPEATPEVTPEPVVIPASSNIPEQPEQPSEPEKTEEPEITETPENTETPETDEIPEVIDIPEILETPEGTPDTEEPEETEEIDEVEPDEELEDIDVEIPVVPEGAPEDEEPEEEIAVDIPDVPEGLPQTGTADVLGFYGFGIACVGLGAIAVRKALRKEEDAEI